jgi:DNA-directed RNA polymerase specialized sigma24 family protein
MSKRNRKAVERLKEDFLCLLPDIDRYARHCFRRCRAADREELAAETIARAWLFFVRLSARGKDPKRVFRSLLRFCVLGVKDGRRVGGHRNCRELCHRARRDGLRICSLGDCDDTSRSPWKAILAETKAVSPAETAAARLDIEAWLRSQSARNRSIANLLAGGERTSAVARRFRLSGARISQLRNELRESWEKFQGSTEETANGIAAIT